MTTEGDLEAVWRQSAPRVLGALVRRYGDLDAAEDAAQEALLAAARQWPDEGVPRDPAAWLVRVASRRLIDAWRTEQARGTRETTDALRAGTEALVAPGADTAEASDDSLALLLLCCHPALSRPSRVALTLRAVSGLTTAQVAHGFLVPETTMAQRISRAKATLREVGASFVLPAPTDLPERVATVAQVLYLVFTEGHTSSRGESLVDTSLASEAIRLTRQLHTALPTVPEVSGLLALMLLTHARRATRTSDTGVLVPLAEQDRSRWDGALLAEGVALVEAALPDGPVGPYQLQAAIAAVHAEAPTARDTDWPQIVELYGMLARLDPSPVVTLNRAVAVAEVEGPAAGLATLTPLLGDRTLRRHHRLYAVQAHLLERSGQRDEACAAYELAASLATSVAEQRYLRERRGRLG